MISTKEQSTISLIASQNMYAIRLMLDTGHITGEELMSAMLCISDSGEYDIESVEFLIELTNIMEDIGCFEDTKCGSIIDFLFETAVDVGKTCDDNIRQCIIKLIDNKTSFSEQWFHVSLMCHDLFLYCIERNGITFTTDVLSEVCSNCGKPDNVVYAIDNMVLLGTENETIHLCTISHQLSTTPSGILYKYFIQKLSDHPDIDIIVFSSLRALIHGIQYVIDCTKGLDIYDNLLVLQKIVPPDRLYQDINEFDPEFRDVVALMRSSWNWRDVRHVYNDVIKRVAVLSEHM